MRETRYVKICDGFRVTYDGETYEIENSLSKLWDMIGWGDDDDEVIREARGEVLRHLYGWGYIDMTCAMPKGHTLRIDVIPCKN